MKTGMVTLKESKIADRVRAYEWLYYSDFSPCPSTMRRPGSMGKPTLDEFCTDHSDHLFNGSSPEKGRAFIIVMKNTGEEIGLISYDCNNCGEKSVELDMWMKSSSYTGQGFGPAAVRLLADDLFNKGYKNLLIRATSDSDPLAKAFLKAGFSSADEKSGSMLKGQTETDRSHVLMMSK